LSTSGRKRFNTPAANTRSMERISISLPEKLLREFDRVLREKGYVSRSEGIRDAIRSYIIEHSHISNLPAEIAGTVSVIYDHEKGELLERLTHTQHEFSEIIQSTLHLHLDRRNCMEVIVVRGSGSRVREFVDRIRTIKGVKFAKLTTSVPEVLS